MRAQDESISPVERPTAFMLALNCKHRRKSEQPDALRTVSALMNGGETEILVVPRSVEGITRDTLLALPSFRPIVVDRNSTARPEDCNSRSEGERHVSIFRLNRAHPPFASYPDTLFRAGASYTVLMYSVELRSVVIGGQTLACSGGYCVWYVRFGAPCTLDVRGVGRVEVREWGHERNHGVVDGGLQVPYGVYDVEAASTRAIRSSRPCVSPRP